jgi:hypothetical protein
MEVGMLINKFTNGDRVRVSSGCNTHGRCGTVTRYIAHPCAKYVQVQLDNGSLRSYNEASLELLNKKEEDIIMKVNGNYNVAMVKLLKDANISTTTKYAFALFDNEIACEDLVLCDTVNGYVVGKITDIITQDEYQGNAVTKEIICKVDFAAFEQRKANRIKAHQIQKEMDKKIKGIQEMMLYEMMAEKNPELKEMLEQYKALIG